MSNKISLWKRQSIVRQVSSSQRLYRCGRQLAPHKQTVDFWRVTETDEEPRIDVYNLYHCGDEWCCPVCEGRKLRKVCREVERAYLHACVLGLHTYMMTLTIQHEYRDSLKDVADRLKRAKRDFYNSRGFKRLMEGFDYHGDIVTTEVLHGVNGWHVHFHILIFAKAGWGEGKESELLALWSAAAVKNGVRYVNEHGIDYHDCYSEGIAKYITKLMVSAEMSDTVFKDRTYGYTPYELALRAQQGDQEARRCWDEFERDIHGYHKIRFAGNLRAKLHLKEEWECDKEKAAPLEEFAGWVGSADWLRIIEANLREEFLESMRVPNEEQYQRIIANARAQVPHPTQ